MMNRLPILAGIFVVIIVGCNGKLPPKDVDFLYIYWSGQTDVPHWGFLIMRDGIDSDRYKEIEEILDFTPFTRQFRLSPQEFKGFLDKAEGLQIVDRSEYFRFLVRIGGPENPAICYRAIDDSVEAAESFEQLSDCLDKENRTHLID